LNDKKNESYEWFWLRAREVNLGCVGLEPGPYARVVGDGLEDQVHATK